MNDFSGVLSLQVDAIVAALHADRETRCRALMRDARNNAGRLLAETRRQTRQRIYQAIDEERGRRELALREAESRAAAAARQKVQVVYLDILDKAWPMLRAELAARWARPESRRDWCAALVTEATRRLGHGKWTVEHPADLPDEDVAWLRDRADESGVPQLTLRADPGLAAGLRISQQNARLDGSIDGLLADRSIVAAALLAAWERSRASWDPQ